MPTYEYQCQKCGKTFEKVQSMTAPKLEDCPEPGCGGKVKRLLGAGAGLIFKGSGFYITDYRSEGYKKSASAAKSDSGGASSSSGEKSSTPAKSEPAKASTPKPAAD